jgi:hypothetical protein
MTPRIQLATAPFHPDIQAVLDRVPREWMPPFHLFTALARDRRVFQRFTRGGMIDLDNGHLSLRQREVLLGRVLARTGNEYEWGLRIHFFAEGAGLTPEQIHSAVHGGPGDTCWSEEDRGLIRLADALHDHCTVTDDLWTELRERFSEEAILELLYLAGYYRSVGCIANTLRLPLEDKIGISFPPSRKA